MQYLIFIGNVATARTFTTNYFNFEPRSWFAFNRRLSTGVPFRYFEAVAILSFRLTHYPDIGSFILLGLNKYSIYVCNHKTFYLSWVFKNKTTKKKKTAIGTYRCA